MAAITLEPAQMRRQPDPAALLFRESTIVEDRLRAYADRLRDFVPSPDGERTAPAVPQRA